MGELLPWVCQCQDLPSSAISVVRIERDIFLSLENTYSLMKQLREGDKEDSVYVIIFLIFFLCSTFRSFFTRFSSAFPVGDDGEATRGHIMYFTFMRWFITTQTRIMLSSPTCSSRLLVGSSGNVAVLMQYSATWRIMARRAVCPLAFERTPSVSLSMLNFSFRWAHRDRQWRVHRCFIKFVGLGRLVKINNTQKDVFEWEYFTRRSWVSGSAGLHISSTAKTLSDVQNYADFDWRSRLLKRNVHISE